MTNAKRSHVNTFSIGDISLAKQSQIQNKDKSKIRHSVINNKLEDSDLLNPDITSEANKSLELPIKPKLIKQKSRDANYSPTEDLNNTITTY